MLDLKAIFDDDRGCLSVEPSDGTPNYPDELPPDWREQYEERAAIREFDGGQAREHAEAEALRETIMAMRAANHSIRQPTQYGVYCMHGN